MRRSSKPKANWEKKTWYTQYDTWFNNNNNNHKNVKNESVNAGASVLKEQTIYPIVLV